ncbi:MAG: delta-lactam-biosynthetic de-N-acetylase [Defluviitaleaceae bacterium]|nr:delta-lactam-biosynthetic de-N-acetylase [Defluviitaleaceae bacterium]
MKGIFKAILLVGLAMVFAASGFSNEHKRWYFKRTSDNTPPGAQSEIDIAQFGAYFLGDTSQKEVYLTFDEGYENGYTEKILDVLLEKDVPAAFFVTKSYIKDNPALIGRMVAEGHIVGNHTIHHKSSPTLSQDEMAAELNGVAEYFKESTGHDMPPFFRPPMGEYSEKVLAIAQECGYHTIFWSFAYEDWIQDKQPGAATAHKRVMDGLHNGAILLLHAVSSSNAEAMGDIIDSVRAEGYEFKSLYNLPNIYSHKGGILWNH